MSPRKPVRVPLGSRLGDFVRGPVPLILWLLSGYGVYRLLEMRHGLTMLSGIAQGDEARVTALRPGKLHQITVRLHDEVRPGDVVAILDGTLLQARLETMHSRVAEIEAELLSEQERIERENALATVRTAEDFTQGMRRFLAEETDLALQVLEIKVDLESDRLQEQRVAAELARASRLAAEEVGVVADAEDLDLEHQQVLRRIEEREALLVRAELESDSAGHRRKNYEQSSPSPLAQAPLLLKALKARIDVERALLAEVSVEQTELLLRAPLEGRVQSLLALEGECVLEGTVVATITKIRADRVVAYLPEFKDPSCIEPLEDVAVAQSFLQGQSGSGRVESLSPGLVEIPSRLWTQPNRPEYGRAVWISFDKSLALLAGERVEVFFQN